MSSVQQVQIKTCINTTPTLIINIICNMHISIDYNHTKEYTGTLTKTLGLHETK